MTLRPENRAEAQREWDTLRETARTAPPTTLLAMSYGTRRPRRVVWRGGPAFVGAGGRWRFVRAADVVALGDAMPDGFAEMFA